MDRLPVDTVEPSVPGIHPAVGWRAREVGRIRALLDLAVSNAGVPGHPAVGPELATGLVPVVQSGASALLRPPGDARIAALLDLAASCTLGTPPADGVSAVGRSPMATGVCNAVDAQRVARLPIRVSSGVVSPYAFPAAGNRFPPSSGSTALTHGRLEGRVDKAVARLNRLERARKVKEKRRRVVGVLREDVCEQAPRAAPATTIRPRQRRC